VARKPKALTREQLQGRKDQAVRFTHDVVGDPDRADEIQSESLEDYAQRRHIQLLNPRRRQTMARKTTQDYRDEIADLKDQLSDLEDENETLQDTLDNIAGIASGEDEDLDESDSDDDSDDDED